jgi:hypothetical protein
MDFYAVGRRVYRNPNGIASCRKSRKIQRESAKRRRNGNGPTDCDSMESRMVTCGVKQRQLYDAIKCPREL